MKNRLTGRQDFLKLLLIIKSRYGKEGRECSLLFFDEEVGGRRIVVLVA